MRNRNQKRNQKKIQKRNQKRIQNMDYKKNHKRNHKRNRKMNWNRNQKRNLNRNHKRNQKRNHKRNQTWIQSKFQTCRIYKPTGLKCKVIYVTAIYWHWYVMYLTYFSTFQTGVSFVSGPYFADQRVFSPNIRTTKQNIRHTHQMFLSVTGAGEMPWKTLKKIKNPLCN